MNPSVFVYPVAPEDGTGVTFWLNYYENCYVIKGGIMEKETIPFGRAMDMKVAFCNAIAIDFSQAKRIIWVSGQLAFDENEKFVGKDDIGAQTEQCIKNIESALKKLGGSLDDVVQVTVFVTEMSGLRLIHEVRLRYFKEPYPTSTLVEVKGFVNPDALIEINAVAVL